MATEVRVRFAPSPTGGLHIGGVRTALYNYLFARNKGGTFILRIEDTDQNRKVEGAEQYILDALEWCGISPDESPVHGGKFGPYRQSERLDLYRKYVMGLVEQGHAYYAFDTTQELDAMRQRLQNEKADLQQYGWSTRLSMSNSLTLDQDEVKKRIEQGEPYVIRLKVPADETVVVNDLVRGEVKVKSSIIDDKILLKSDGFPTYHLANVVDDHLMKISHVIRGEEWLPSAPLHVLLYQLLGWGHEIPQFAHLPLLLKPEGSGKLSKRDADKHGFPIFPLSWMDPRVGEEAIGFREQGYIPEALVNFLAMLGWNPGTEEEIFTLAELANIFELKGINKSGAKFDIEKAKWYNEVYLRRQSVDELALKFSHVVSEKGHDCSPDKAHHIIAVLLDRVTFFDDFWNQGSFFFVEPSEYDEQMARKKWNEEVAKVLMKYAERLSGDILEQASEAKQLLWETADAAGMSIGKVMPGLRLALTGFGGGPDLMDIMQILGIGEVRARIQKASEHLS